MFRANVKLSLLLAGAMVTTQVPVQAFTAKEAVLPTALGLAAISAFLLATKEPDPKFKSRFNGRMFRNVKKMTSKEYYKNLWYLFWDEFIGQKSKTSKVKANSENGALEWSQKALSAGICGRAYDYLKSLKDANGTLQALALLGGAYIWVNKKFLGGQEPKKEEKKELDEEAITRAASKGATEALLKWQEENMMREAEQEKYVTKIYSDGPINVKVHSPAQVEGSNGTKTSEITPEVAVPSRNYEEVGFGYASIGLNV